MSNEFTDNYFKPCIKDFVSTVLLIDDQLEYNETQSMSGTVGSLITPVQGDTGNQNDENQEESANDRETSDVERRTIQIAELIKHFSKEKLLVTPINPQKLNAQNKNECIDMLLNLAGKADVIVLDWDVNVSFNDGSSISTNDLSNQLINQMKSDKKYRLVMIYTADNPANIALPICENIEIKKYCKSAIHRRYYKTYEQLANQIKKDYLSSKKGLLSLILLKILTQLRHSTYAMLNTLNKDYDLALLYHRILLTTPDKITDFCNDVIADEILSHISSDIIKTNLHKDVFKKYLQENGSLLSFQRNPSSERACPNESEIDSVLQVGYKAFVDETTADSISKGKCLDCIVKNNDLAKLKAFSCYSMMLNSESRPNLHLGCIVQLLDVYYLCIQPPCDSERLKRANEIAPSNPPHFLFLQLEKDNSTPDFFIKRGTSYIGLKVIYSGVRSMAVYGDEQGVVALEDNKYKLLNDVSLEYIGCLKPMYAQKIANAFAANISRVGVDQFEWLRLKGR